MNFKKKFNKFQEKFDAAPFFFALCGYFLIKTNYCNRFSLYYLPILSTRTARFFPLFRGKLTVLITAAPVMTGNLDSTDPLGGIPLMGGDGCSRD